VNERSFVNQPKVVVELESEANIVLTSIRGLPAAFLWPSR
jgi:hypothetical protein